jgi:hypothetical protein
VHSFYLFRARLVYMYRAPFLTKRGPEGACECLREYYIKEKTSQCAQFLSYNLFLHTKGSIPFSLSFFLFYFTRYQTFLKFVLCFIFFALKNGTFRGGGKLRNKHCAIYMGTFLSLSRVVQYR